MKDYGSEHPVLRRLPSRANIASALLLGLVIFICQTLFLLTLAGVASGPAAHPAAPHLAPLLSSPTTNPSTTEQLAPPNGIARLQSWEGEQ